MSERRNTAGLWLAGIAILIIGVVAFRMRPRPADSEPDGLRPGLADSGSGQTGDSAKDNDGQSQSNVPSLVQQAQSLQQERRWCDARTAWEQVQRACERGTLEKDRWESVAVGNIAVLEKLCEPPEHTVPKNTPVEVPPPPEDQRPALINEKQLLKVYPKGRRIRGDSDLVITGKGRSRDWGLEGTQSFRFLGRATVETIVESNDGAKLVFVVEFPEVSQSLIVFNREAELRPPEMPVLETLWETYGNVIRHIPVYVQLKGLVDLGMIVDPRLKRTLTWLVNQLPPDTDITLKAKLDELDGKQFRVRYYSGRGVTFIEDLDGGQFTENELIDIADSISLMMDHYLVPTSEKKVGEEWTVPFQEVAGLMNLGSQAHVSGSLHLRREESPAGRQEWVLGVRGGQVRVQTNDPSADQESQADFRSGIIHYDADRVVVRDARLILDATSLWRSQDHLLFAAEDFKDVSVEAIYVGERLDDSTVKPKP